MKVITTAAAAALLTTAVNAADIGNGLSIGAELDTNWKYDAEADAFHPEKPYPSWTLNTTTYVYDAPVAHPNDGSFYEWNEETQAWDELT